MKSAMSITICSDFNNDLKGAIALLYSIKKHTNFKKLNIVSTMDNLDNVNKVLDYIYKLELEPTVQLIDEEIKWVGDNVNKSKYNELEHINIFAFARMFIPSLIDDNEETIYLDTDTLFVSDYVELTNKQKEMPMSVVNNGMFSPIYWLKKYEGIYKNRREVRKYAFNSGVIFFNKSKKREELYNRMIDSIRVNDFNYMDQAHLNHVLKGNVSYVDIRYNFPHHHIDKKQLLNIEGPIIIHFASSNKPWNENVEETKWTKIWLKYFKSAIDIYNK